MSERNSGATSGSDPLDTSSTGTGTGSTGSSGSTGVSGSTGTGSTGTGSTGTGSTGTGSTGTTGTSHVGTGDTTRYDEHDRNPGHLGEERVESHTTRSHAEPVVRQEHHEVGHEHRDHDHDHDRRPAVALGADRHDGVRWGPIWAGLLTALTSFLLLELAFYAAGAIDLRGEGSDNDGIITGVLALVAFFLGGLVAGATALWKGLFSGLLHGFLVWAVGVVAFIALTFFGASALLGSFGDLTSQLGVGPQEVSSATQVSGAEAEKANQDAQDAAAPAFWGLLLPLLASMAGGLIGSKMWPRKKDQAVTGSDRR